MHIKLAEPQMNSHVPRRDDGSYLMFPGVADDKSSHPREHE
jgi:hypothetical protein